MEARGFEDVDLEARDFDSELDLASRDFLDNDDLLEMREPLEDDLLEMREPLEDDLEMREPSEDDMLEMRQVEDELFNLVMRDFFDELEARAKFGFGLRKQPKTATFKTPSAKYTGDEVNKAAKKALKNVEAGKKVKGYPKEGSGFRKSEAKADPTKGKGKSYHAPLRKKGAPYPGPDRVIVNKKPGKTKYTSHVAYHDPKKPVPKGTGAKSNPFTKGKQKFNGKGR